ncbi:MAG: four helix bundle protein [Candidatus Omnitrophica bacterium]|jgi:four helix bundle protein|nr:four helix bundle protein [Candidatus Omnitrophota bacterium]
MENKGASFQSNYDIKNRTYAFSVSIVNFVSDLPKDNATHIISNQLLASATSVGANVIEAQASSSRKDFTNFLNHSLKSGNETKYWLCLLRDTGRAEYPKVSKLINEVTEINNILGKSIITLRNK